MSYNKNSQEHQLWVHSGLLGSSYTHLLPVFSQIAFSLCSSRLRRNSHSQVPPQLTLHLALVEYHGLSLAPQLQSQKQLFNRSRSPLIHSIHHLLGTRHGDTLLQPVTSNLADTQRKRSPCRKQRWNLLLQLLSYVIPAPRMRLDMFRWLSSRWQVTLLHHVLEIKLPERSGGVAPPHTYRLQNTTK